MYCLKKTQEPLSTATNSKKKELTHECPQKHPLTGTPRIRQGKEIKEDTQESTYIQTNKQQTIMIY